MWCAKDGLPCWDFSRFSVSERSHTILCGDKARTDKGCSYPKFDGLKDNNYSAIYVGQVTLLAINIHTHKCICLRFVCFEGEMAMSVPICLVTCVAWLKNHCHMCVTPSVHNNDGFMKMGVLSVCQLAWFGRIEQCAVWTRKHCSHCGIQCATSFQQWKGELPKHFDFRQWGLTLNAQYSQTWNYRDWPPRHYSTPNTSLYVGPLYCNLIIWCVSNLSCGLYCHRGQFFCTISKLYKGNVRSSLTWFSLPYEPVWVWMRNNCQIVLAVMLDGISSGI